MFNTKRIEENVDAININFKFLKESLTKLKDVVGVNASKFNDLIDWKNSLTPCSTCKCLIKKEDAVKGKSEIVRKDMAILESCGDKKYGTFIEELVTPYYCHNKDCKPKK